MRGMVTQILNISLALCASFSVLCASLRAIAGFWPRRSPVCYCGEALLDFMTKWKSLVVTWAPAT